MTGSDILVVVPHSGISIPPEISLEDLTDDFTALLKNVDWFTEWLYDFRDILGNRQLVFPYCSGLLDANRDPADIDECVPVKDVFGRPNLSLRATSRLFHARGLVGQVSQTLPSRHRGKYLSGRRFDL